MSVDRSAEEVPSGSRAASRAVVLLACAFLAGAAVMIYEFLAVRILQRLFGGIMDVWASEIAVCLGGLAAGYSVGGLLADRYRSWKPIGLALIAAGASALLIEPLAMGVGERLLDVEVAQAWHPLIVAGVSSFLPILALGCVQPQLVRLWVRDMAHVGSGAGWVASVSTVGSIAGVLLLVHGLLPRLGVRETLLATSAALVALGVFFAALDRLRLAVILLAILTANAQANAQIVFEDYSAYHHILVEDRGSLRTLLFDDQRQSQMSLANPIAGGFEYTEFFHVPLLFNPTARRVLFLGLGGGTGPKAFLACYPQVFVEVAEIDPMVLDVALRFFALPRNPRMKVTIEDGRVFLRRSNRMYGAIVMDAYTTSRYGAYMPYHMTTQEFFTLAWRHLDHGGCFVHNVMGKYRAKNDQSVRDIQKTLESVFQAVYVFEAKTSGNTVFVAVKLDLAQPLPDSAGRPGNWPNGPWLQHPMNASDLRALAMRAQNAGLLPLPILSDRVTQIAEAQYAPRTGNVLTDNYAPVDIGSRGR